MHPAAAWVIVPNELLGMVFVERVDAGAEPGKSGCVSGGRRSERVAMVLALSQEGTAATQQRWPLRDRVFGMGRRLDR